MSIDHVARLSTSEKRELLRDLILRKQGRAEGLIPLAFGQKALWFVYQTAPDSSAYNFVYAARIHEAVDPEALRLAFGALAGRHPLLRATVQTIGLKPYLRIHDRLDLTWRVIDASGRDWDGLVAEIREDAARPFDLQAEPPLRATLYRLGPREYVLALAGHHILADLWSMVVLLEELRALYSAARSGQPSSLPAPAAEYADFVRWQSLLVAGPEGQKSWDYWRGKLAGELPRLNLTTDRRRPPVQTFRGRAHAWTPDLAVIDRVRDLAAREKSTAFTTLLAAFQVLLFRYTGQSDLILGTATSGRGRPEWERVVGYFLNQVALRATVTGSDTFLSLLRRARVDVLQALEHENFPFGLLVERLHPARDPARSPIFQAVFIWDKPTVVGDAAPTGTSSELEFETVLMEQCGAPFDLALIFIEDGPTLTAHLRYNADLFDASTIARMAGHLDVLLRAIVDDPDRRISDLPMLTSEDRWQLGCDQAASRGPRKPARAGHHLFEDQVRRSPEATALVSGAESITYRELNSRANRLARHLGHLGVGPGVLVGLCIPRSIEMIVAVLAAWKAGASYVALDPAYPDRRIGEIVNAARPAVVLTGQVLAPRLSGLPTNVVCLDDARVEIDGHDDDDLPGEVPPEAQAYVIFTSGSTGQPKGVLLRHRGLSTMTDAQRDVFELGGRDRVLQFASLSFDASVFEILLALRCGAALVLAPASAILLGEGLLSLLRDQAVTAATLPPSILSLLPREELPDLRTIIVAGEACPAELVSAWAPGRRFFNAYGPTEATVWSTVARCVADGSTPTIGGPIAGVRTYVLDEHQQPVPTGVPGELFLAGPGLAVGYLDSPGPTASAFVHNPFDAEDDGVMYRTGDLVRARPDGQLEYLGRMDRQVKIRGYRIDPSEVESVLRRHPSVRDAVVIAHGADTPSSCILVAYAAFEEPDLAPIDEIRAMLREHLPHYMLPAAVVPLSALPLTSNGKIDRKALPPFESSKNGSRHAAVAPRDDMERRLVSIWAEVLDVDVVGIHDNFFDLGGASLQTLQVVTLARSNGITLTPEMLFQYQTVAELAAKCGPIVVHSPSLGGLTIPSLPIPSFGASRVPVAVARRPAGANTVIESLGVFLPARVVKTSELLAGCRVPVGFPLERMTGIKSRRMAGETEFSFDLAARAVADCLARSSYGPDAVDLLICSNISRCDGPNSEFSYEPSTASRLQALFGMGHAMAFDVSNACAGTFTALALADSFLRVGSARRVMVVSGEYISHLTGTAQREITDFVDPRMACLTLGDSGVAMILQRAEADGIGFHDLDLYTLGKYSNLCVAKATDQPHGGAIMITDAVRSSAVTIHQAVSHALGTLRRRGWDPASIDHLVMHQTSETTLDGAVREINRAAGKTACHAGNTIYNLAERGNTATNSHFVALMDNIRSGVIRTGARVVFGVSGSGQTVGTATYTLDDLPDRIRKAPSAATPRAVRLPWSPRIDAVRVRIESVGTIPEGEAPGDSVAMNRRAAEGCLCRSHHEKSDIGLIISSGVYRSEFLSEPALAAIVAGTMEINHDGETIGERKTLAFDLLNGAVGTLDACYVAAQMIGAGRASSALILASEVENNAGREDLPLVGVKPTGSALLLEPSTSSEGFGPFLFRSFPEHNETVRAHTVFNGRGAAMHHSQAATFEASLLDCIRATVRELLDREGLGFNDLAVVLPPHSSALFVSELARVLGFPSELVVRLPDEDRDYFTSSLACSFQEARDRGMIQTGDVGLIIAAGSGIQVGCCLYYF